MTTKEYKTLYFDDTKVGREKMQAEFDRASAIGWRVTDMQAVNQRYGIGSAIVVSLAGIRKAKLMIVMERRRGGKCPPEPASPQTARETSAQR